MAGWRMHARQLTMCQRVSASNGLLQTHGMGTANIANRLIMLRPVRTLGMHADGQITTRT